MAVDVRDGKIACNRCKQLTLPDEMHSADICSRCYEALRTRNQGKLKPEGDRSEIIKRNALGWIEREEKPKRAIDEDGFRVSETGDSSIDINSRKSIDRDGSIVSETNNDSTDNHPKEPIDRDGSEVPETKNSISVVGSKKQEDCDGSKVPETSDMEIDNDYEKSISRYASRVSETQIMEMIGDTNELLADCIRRIRILEAKVSSVIEKYEPNRDAPGLEKLRNDLFKIIQDRYDKTHQNGIYVKSLYGPNGRKGGKLHISKSHAWRLREACRMDPRFKIEKADNKRGNWLIRLNFFMK